MVRERYYDEIKKINNQIFLPISYSYVYGIDLDKDISFKELTIEIVQDMEEEEFKKLMNITSFITTLSNLNYSNEEIIQLSKEKFKNRSCDIC